MAVASAVECTATVEIPNSRQARWMRSAISPRLAIRILRNKGSVHDHQDFAELDRRTVLHQDAADGAGLRGFDLIEGFHCLDQ